MKFYTPFFVFISACIYAQTNDSEVQKALQEKEKLEKTSWFKSLIFQNIGPTIIHCTQKFRQI